MAIVPLPGGGGYYDDVTGAIVSYAVEASAPFAPGGVPLLPPLLPPLVQPVPQPLPPFGGLAPRAAPLPALPSLPISYSPAPGGSPMGAAISLSSVLRALSFLAVAVPAIQRFISEAIPGRQLSLDLLPSWVKDAMIAAGLLAVGAGAAYLVWDLLTPGNGGNAQGIVPAGFNRAWEANGVVFYRNASGMLGVLNSKGRWKQWRPKKPIVLYSTGASDLKTFLRAGKALTRQARELKTIIERQAGGAPSRKPRERLIPESQAIRLIEAAGK